MCIMYGVALVSMCMLVSSVSPSAQRASVTALLLMIAGYLIPGWSGLGNIGYDDNRLIFARVCIALHPTLTMSVLLSYIAEYEILSKDATDELFTSPVVPDGIAGIGEFFIWFLIQTVGYALLSVYFEEVMPSKYGFQQPWNFFVTKSYWSPDASDERELKQVSADADDPERQVDVQIEESKEPGISIVRLNKTYPGNKVAVNNVTCTFYKKEITAFLGHNGAGKSTTMNMLTGMISPTSGTALINGQSILHNMSHIRTSLGYCPQYDIIYPNLTVQQNLEFFGAIKGISVEDVNDYLNQVMKKMSMGSIQQTTRLVRNLSGGMKRKLSIAISFLGSPTTIILDEPTSAIDPFSRRAIWDLILSFKNTATILISTHYMQEADVLGDRIAIINGGMLKCVGSPLYLKNKYGNGSTLTMAHDENINHQEVLAELSQICDVQLSDHSQSETSFLIPREFTRSTGICTLLQKVETNLQNWNIKTFGFQESTLEQVFFKVAAEGADKEEHERPASSPAKIGYTKTGTVQRWMMHLQTTISKRFYLNMRMKKTLVFQIVIPVLFCLLLAVFNNMLDDAFNYRPARRTMSDNDLPDRLIAYEGEEANSGMWLSVMATGMGPHTCTTSNCTAAQWSVRPLNLSYDDLPSCQCQVCPDEANGPTPPKAKLPSGETVLNVVGRNLTAYLIRTNEKYMIGAFEQRRIKFEAPATIMASFVKAQQTHRLNQMNSLQQPDANVTSTTTTNSSNMNGGTSPWSLFGSATMGQATTLGLGPLLGAMGQKGPSVINTEGILTSLSQLVGGDTYTHSEDLYVLWTGFEVRGGRAPTFHQLNMRFMKAAYLNGFWNAFTRWKDSNTKPTIRMSDEEVLFADDNIGIMKFINGVLLGLFTSFALVMPSFIVQYFIVTECATGNKQLQMLCGLNAACYWIGNLVYDLVLFAVSVLLMVTVMVNLPDVFTVDLMLYTQLCMLYGLTVILASYCLSFVVSSARNSILLVGLSTYIMSIAQQILMVAFTDEDWYDSVNNASQYLPPNFVSASVSKAAIHAALPDEVKERADVYTR